MVVLVWADKTARKNYPVGKGFGIENMMVFNTGEFTAAAQIIRLEIEKLAYANLYQASEEKFEQIFNQTPLFSLITGFESGLILAINEAFIQITGFTREELFGHTTEELGLWENPQEIDRIARKLQKEPKIEAIDINYLSRDKENRIFRAAVERIDYLGKEAMLFSGEDVTARVLFERAAERNHGDLTRAQKLPHLGNWTLDLKTDSLHFSEELYQIFGLSHLEGDFQESYYVRIHPNDREFVRNTHANVKQKFKPFDIEFRIITPDGTLKYIREIGDAIRDSDEKVVGLFGMIQDITEYKKMQIDIRERLKELTCLYQAAQLFQDKVLTVEEICQKVVDLIPPAMQFPSITAARLEIYQETFHTGNWIEDLDYCLEASINIDSGQIGKLSVYYRENAPFLIPEEQNLVDNLARMIGLWKKRHQSMLEVHENSRQYQNALEGMLEGIQILDFDWRYLFINSAAEKQNRKPASEMIGRRYAEIWPDIEESEVYQRIKDCLENRVPYEMENEFTFPDKQIGWFELSIEPTRAGVLIHSVDITERKKVAAQMEKQKMQMQNHLRLLNLLTETSTNFINLSSEDATREFDNVLKMIGEIEAVDRSYIFRIDAHTGLMSNTNEWCAPNIEPQIDEFQDVPQKTFPWWMGELNKGKVIYIPNVADLPIEAKPEQDILESQSIQSVLAIPLIAKDRLLGFLGFDSVKEMRYWSEDTIMLIHMTGDILSSVIIRNEAERELKQSNANYELISRNSQDVIWSLDVETQRITYLSPSIEKLRGYKPEAALKQSLQEIFTPDSYQAMMDSMWDSVSAFEQTHTTQTRTMELTQTRKDGSTVETEVVTNLAMDNEGKLRMVGVSRDISERKYAEMELRNSEERFRQIAENMQEVFWMMDRKDDKIIYLSPAFETVWDLPVQGILDGSIDFINTIHPEDRKQVKADMQRQLKGMKVTMNYRIIRPDGEIRWISDKSSPIFNADGEIVRTLGISNDVTEQRLYDERLKQRADDLDLINNINLAKNRGDDLSQIIKIMAEKIREIFGCKLVATFTSDEVSRSIQLVNINIEPGLRRKLGAKIENEMRDAQLSIPIDASNEFSEILHENKPTLLNSKNESLKFLQNINSPAINNQEDREMFKSLSFENTILAPLKIHENLVGLLCLGRPERFTEEEIKRIGIIADQFTTAINRRRMEHMLQSSEEKYRGLVESLDNVIATVNQDGRFLYMNDVAARSLGGTPQELIGKTIHELFGEPSATKQLESTRKAFFEDISIVTESPIMINGKIEWYRTSLQPIHDENGKVVNVLVNSLNINQLKTTQQELMELNRTLEERVEERTAEVQDLYENAPVGYHSLDPSGRFVLVNQTELNWLGYTRDEVIGKPVQNFLTRESIEAFKVNFPEYIKRGWLRDLELDFIRKDGSVLQTLVSATAINDADGNYAMSRSTMTDIGERKKADMALRESQAKLQDFLDSANDLIQTVNENCAFTYVNKAWCNTLGYTPEEAVQLSMYDIVDPSSHAHCKAIIENLNQDQDQDPMCIEVIFKTKAGKLVFVEGSVVAHADSNGQVLINGIFRDVTQRRQAEQALRNSRDELRAANMALEKAAQLKDEFLASMSHELRTPLTGVLGLSEALQLETYGPLTENQQKALKDIESSGRHLLELINDILDLSKIEAEKLDLQLEACSVSEICQASLQLVKGMAEKKHQKIEFKTNLANAIIQADPRRMKQMLVNLLSNAVKFTPEGGSLGMDVEGVEELNTIEFNVWDKGIGIKSEDLSRLFTPFVQLDSSLSRQQSGTGLGLSLVLRLAELHGGSVSVESDPSKGSCFTVSLPWYPHHEEQEKEKEDDQPLSISRCLLIEDNLIHSNQISSYLEQLHIECIPYHSGQGAFETAIKIHPDVIMLDLHLPDKSGEDVLKELKKDPRTSHIVVIISSVEDDRNYYLNQGAAGYLVKPFTLTDVKNEFSRVFNRSEDQHDLSGAKNTQATVLVVDDNQIVLDTVADFLKTRSFYVVQAHNGQEMINLTPEIKPDIILADIQMPGMDGLEAIRRVRALENTQVANVPIIAVTALAMVGDREKCLQAGANEYLSKPIKLTELEDTINQVIKNAKKGHAKSTE